MYSTGSTSFLTKCLNFSILVPDENQIDLETENTPDGMDGEQTWPTDEELEQADKKGK